MAGPGGQSKPSKAAFRCKLVNYYTITVNAAQRTHSSSLLLASAHDPEHFKGVSSCVFQRVPQSARPPRQTRSGETGSLRKTSELPRGAAAAAAAFAAKGRKKDANTSHYTHTHAQKHPFNNELANDAFLRGLVEPVFYSRFHVLEQLEQRRYRQTLAELICVSWAIFVVTHLIIGASLR